MVQRSTPIQAWKRLLPRLPSRLVERPRVARLLNRRLPLTILAAPHGYGKTTAVVGWLRGNFADEDLVLRVDIAGKSTPDEAWAEVLEWFTGETSDDPATALGAFDAWLRQADDPVTLSFDSSHLLPERALLDQVVELLRSHSRLYVLLALRSVPTSMVDLAHAIDVTLITQRELGFLAEDSLELFTAYDVGADVERCVALHEAVNGWPTLVHRAALAVVEHVYNQRGQPPGVPDPMPGLEAARASALGHVAGTMLSQLMTSDQRELAGRCALVGSVDSHNVHLLFEETDEEGEAVVERIRSLAWTGVLTPRQELDSVVWTMPDLIGQALRSSTEPNLPPDQVEALLRRFVEHFVSREQWPQAVEVALRLDDHQLLTDVIADGWTYLSMSHEDLLREAVGQVPDEVFSTNPVAQSVKGVLGKAAVAGVDEERLPDDPAELAELARSDSAERLVIDHLTFMLSARTDGRLENASNRSDRLVRFIDEVRLLQPQAAQRVAPSIYTQAAVTSQLTDDMAGAQRLFLRALEIGADDPSHTTIPSAEAAMALHHAIEGRNLVAQTWIERARQHPPHPGWLGRRMLTPRLLAEAWLALERLDKAEVDPLIGQLVAQSEDDELWGYIVEIRSMYDLLWEDGWSAIDHLQWLRRRRGAHAPPGSYADHALTFALADHQLVLGQATLASQTLLAVRPDHPGVGLRRATIALVAGDPEAVLAESLAPKELSLRRRGHIALLRALALHAIGDLAGASQAAEQSLQSMRTHGFRTPLASVPRSRLADLIDQVDLTEDSRELVELMLAFSPSPLPSQVELIELTDRERVVLKGIELGLSVSQMAAADFVSVNTIKSQARTLYRKLDASSRGEALVRARALGLLAD